MDELISLVSPYFIKEMLYKLGFESCLQYSNIAFFVILEYILVFN
jgi:hypothetical protein